MTVLKWQSRNSKEVSRVGEKKNNIYIYKRVFLAGLMLTGLSRSRSFYQMIHPPTQLTGQPGDLTG